MVYRKSTSFLLLILFLSSAGLSHGGDKAGANKNSGNPRFNETDSLNNLAAQQLAIDFASARSLAEKAGKLAKELGYHRGSIESTCILSAILANTNHCYDALQLLNEVYQLAQISGDSIGKGRINEVKGKCFYYLAAYDSSKHYFETAIDIFTKTGAVQHLAAAYNQLAKVYIKTGEAKQAQFYYNKALAANKNENVAAAWSMDVLGEIYYAQRLFEKAMATFLKSQQEFAALNHQPGIASAALHAGNTYYMMVEDDSAKKYYRHALDNYELLGDSNGIAICYSNLSRIALESGNSLQAIEFANRALATIRGGDYKLIETATLQHLGDIYSEQKQYEKAIGFINEALAVAKRIDHKLTMMDCHKSLSETYMAMNKPAMAHENLLLAYRLKDSLQPIAFSKQLAEIQDQLETEKKESRIKLLEQNNRIKSFEINEQFNQINKRNILIILFISIFILVVTTGYLAAQKQKLKTAIETATTIKTTEENERLRFARDVHDDLGSGLSKINFLSELIVADNMPKGEARENAAAISETSKSLIENMRDLIWALNPENTTLDHLLASIREYASDYLEEYKADLVFNFPEKVSELTISKEGHREIFMTVKECLNNIVKHSKATRIVITATEGNDRLSVTIKDNGTGIPSEGRGSGNGLHNMKNRIEAIGGVFTLESNVGGGTTVNALIPLDKISA